MRDINVADSTINILSAFLTYEIVLIHKKKLSMEIWHSKNFTTSLYIFFVISKMEIKKKNYLRIFVKKIGIHT